MTPEVHPAHVLLTTRDGSVEFDGFAVVFEDRAGIRRMHPRKTLTGALAWAARLAERQTRAMDL